MLANIKLIVVLIALIIAGALVFLLILPQWNELKSVREALSQTKARLNEVQERVGLFEGIQKKYQGAADQNYTDTINYALPASPQTSDLLVQLESLPLRSGLSMTSISITPPVEKTTTPSPSLESQAPTPSVQTLAINFGLTGKYQDFKNFLIKVEEHIRLIDVNSISFQVGTESDIYKYSVSAQTYFLPQAK